MKAILFNSLLWISIFLVQPVCASHLEGGEITWRVDSNGAFIFKVKIFRDCNGIPWYGSISLTTNAPNFQSGIVCDSVSAIDISPIGPGCPTCSAPMGLSNAVQLFLYESAPITLSGIPPDSGWYFIWNGCCRNTNISNLYNPGGQGMTLCSIMYPFNHMPINPGFDNSPEFLVNPQFSTCNNQPASLSFGAFDRDLDSLTYEFSTPLDGLAPNHPVTFLSPFTFMNPLPDTSSNPLNVPASINHETGTIRFTSYTPGTYVLGVKVTSYKCGVKVAEINREIEVVLIGSCVLPQSTNYNKTPSYTINIGQNTFTNTDVFDTIFAGDSLFVNILAVDNDTNAIGQAYQLTSITPYSPEFGLNYTDSLNGCIVAPCATLNNQNNWSGIGFATLSMEWRTACSHASFHNQCLQHLLTYNYSFKIADNFCPSNSASFANIFITVSGPNIYMIGDSLCISLPPGSNYQWYKDGVAIPNAFDSIYYPTQPGVYSVISNTTNGCELVSNVLPRLMTDVTSASKFDWLMKYTRNENNIDLIIQAAKSSQAMLQILDVQGRVLESKNLKLQEGLQHIHLNGSYKPNQLLVVQLITTQKTLSTKVF